MSYWKGTRASYHLDRQDYVTKEWIKYRNLLADTPPVELQIIFCRIAGEMYDERHQ